MMQVPCRIPTPPSDDEWEVLAMLVKIFAGITAVVVLMDRMVGGDFEAGLAAIKSLVEAAPKG
jgi:hypothetical protein